MTTTKNKLVPVTFEDLVSVLYDELRGVGGDAADLAEKLARALVRESVAAIVDDVPPTEEELSWQREAEERELADRAYDREEERGVDAWRGTE